MLPSGMKNHSSLPHISHSRDHIFHIQSHTRKNHSKKSQIKLAIPSSPTPSSKLDFSSKGPSTPKSQSAVKVHQLSAYHKSNSIGPDNDQASIYTYGLSAKALSDPVSEDSSEAGTPYSKSKPYGNSDYYESSHPSFMKIAANHKELIERSFQLANRRKNLDDSSSRNNSNINLEPIKKGEEARPTGRTLTRLIDKMIIKGNLPIEAVEFFSSKNSTKSKSQVKLKPLPKREDSLTNSKSGSHRRDSVIELNDESVIPNWMRGLSNFNEKYKSTKMGTKFPIYDILSKDSDARDDLELTFVTRWLEKIDIFAKCSYELIFELAKRMSAIYLEEGEILCNVGDPADCVYIVYHGQIDVLVPEKTGGERMIVRAQSGELLGRQTLDTVGKRTAKLKAATSSYVMLLYRKDYQEVSGDLRNTIRPSQVIHDFITKHSFLRQFSDAKLVLFISRLEFKKHYKNDVIYSFGDSSDKIYLLISGTLTREIPVTQEKINKWPTGHSKWKMYKKTVVYSYKNTVEPGEIFGVTEFMEEKPRSEKIVSEGDALILTCSRKNFFEIFEKYEASSFIKKAQEDDKARAEKITEIFEVQTKLKKIKEDAILNIVSNHATNKVTKNPSQIAKIQEWKRAEEKLNSPLYKEKRILEKSEMKKDLNSVYDR